MEIDFTDLTSKFKQIATDAYSGLLNQVPDLKLTQQQAELVQRQLAALAKVGLALPLASDDDKADLEQEGREAVSNLLDIAVVKEHVGERILHDQIVNALTKFIGVGLAAITVAV